MASAISLRDLGGDSVVLLLHQYHLGHSWNKDPVNYYHPETNLPDIHGSSQTKRCVCIVNLLKHIVLEYYTLMTNQFRSEISNLEITE